MLRLEVVGIRHARWQKLLERTEKAVRETGIDAKIIKVTKPAEITERGIMVTPALTLEGELMCAGSIPTVADIKGWLSRKRRRPRL